MNNSTFRFLSVKDNSVIDKVTAVNSWKARKEFCARHPEYTMDTRGQYYYDIEGERELGKDCFSWNF